MTNGEAEQSTPQLPREIIEDILLRLPVVTLCRFRCVSKSWRGLVSDPHFIKMHLHQSMKNNRKIIASSCDQLFSVEVETLDETSAVELHFPCGHPSLASSGDPLFSVEVETLDDTSAVEFHLSCGYPVKLVGCCNGLICFRHENTICVWNPATKEHIKFPEEKPASGGIRHDFGYNPVTGEYKVLKILGTGVFVRNLAENSWRRVETLPFVHISFTRGEFLNGTLHWVAYRGARPEIIACFDLEDEKFREMLMPDFGDMRTPPSIVAVGGCLCIYFCLPYKDCFEIWVMKEYGDEKSWTKQFSGYSEVLGFQKSGEILVKYEGWMILYDPVNKRMRSLNNCRVLNDAYNHVESLVSPMAGNILQEN